MLEAECRGIPVALLHFNNFTLNCYNESMLVKIEKVSLWKDDERGKIYGFSARESGYFLVLYRKKGSISGDHYHKGTIKSKSPEIFYMISGQAELKVRDTKSGVEETHLVEQGTKIEIPPFIHHAFKAMTDITFLELNVSKEDFDKYESDTVK